MMNIEKLKRMNLDEEFDGYSGYDDKFCGHINEIKESINDIIDVINSIQINIEEIQKTHQLDENKILEE